MNGRLSRSRLTLQAWAGCLLVHQLCACCAYGASDAIVSLAAVGPLTTPSKSFGISHLQGVTLAIEEYNHIVESPGNESESLPTINLLIFDDQANPVLGKSIIANLSSNPTGVLAVLGPCNSSVAQEVISTVLKSDQLPVVSALTTATGLTENNPSPFFFRFNVSDKIRMHELMQQIADTFHAQGLAIFYEEDDPYGEGMRRQLVDSLSNRNSLHNRTKEFAYHRALTAQEADEIVNQAASFGLSGALDASVLCGLETDGIQIVKAIRRKRLKVQVYLPEPAHDVVQTAGSEGVDVTGVRIFTIWDPNSSSLGGFRDRFQAKFIEEPNFAAALSYDATKMLLQAIKSVWRQQATNHHDIAKLRALLRDELASLAPDEQTFAIAGDHHLTKNELTAMQFHGLHYDTDGTLKPWNTPITQQTNPHPLANVQKPTLEAAFIIWAVALVGGAIMLIPGHHANEGWKTLVFSVLVVNPFIALVVFHTAYVVIFFSKRSWLSLDGSISSIFNIAASVVGGLAGLLGVKLINLILSKLGFPAEEATLYNKRKGRRSLAGTGIGEVESRTKLS